MFHIFKLSKGIQLFLQISYVFIIFWQFPKTNQALSKWFEILNVILYAKQYISLTLIKIKIKIFWKHKNFQDFWKSSSQQNKIWAKFVINFQFHRSSLVSDFFSSFSWYSRFQNFLQPSPFTFLAYQQPFSFSLSESFVGKITCGLKFPVYETFFFSGTTKRRFFLDS